MPETKTPDKITELDERLFTTPAVALERAHTVATEMAEYATETLFDAIELLNNYLPELAEKVRENEDKTDHYEDILGSYLVKLSALQISDNDSASAAMLLKSIGDFERISDHGVNILDSAEELKAKNIEFTDSAKAEMETLKAAVHEILEKALEAFSSQNVELAFEIEPLEQVIDNLKERMRTNHILRLQQGGCSIDAGFIWSDLITNFERVSDHCSNIAGCLIDFSHKDMNIHENLRAFKLGDTTFKEKFEEYSKKYSL